MSGSNNDIISDYTVRKLQESIIHEVQHWIQKKEGFPFGSYSNNEIKNASDKNSDKETYQRSFGEIEAREAEGRLFLTRDEKKK